MGKRGKKLAARLERRVRGWENMPSEGAAHGGTVKLIRGYAFRKPGSRKK